MHLIDIHAHLSDVSNVDNEIDRAKANGLAGIIAVGMDRQSNETTLSISARHKDFVLPAMGLHPLNLKDDFECTVEAIEAKINEITAIGEVGLDSRYQTPMDLQKKAFKKILDMAARHDKPLIIHSRTAWREAFDMARDAGVKNVAFHWYSGPVEIMRELLDLGYYVSATPAAAYSKPHRTAIQEAPLDRLLLETDSPVKYHGVAATPSDVLKSLSAVAQLKGIDEQRIAEATTQNAIKLFGLKI
jgi:TatD DNase family protein